MFRTLEKFLQHLSAAAILILGLLITSNVIARGLFNTSLPDTIVIVRELMVVAIVAPLAAATFARSHVVVEFVANRLPVRVCAWLVVFGSVVGLLALAPLVYAGGRELLHTTTSGGFFYGDLNLPKWPGRLAFLFGISACWIRLLVQAIQDVGAIRAGRLDFYQAA